MRSLEVGSFFRPDEVRTLDKTRIEVVRLAGTSVALITLGPGWRWSECLQAVAGTGSCQWHHLGSVISGRMKGVHDDGSEADLGPGDAYVIAPGHDAWVVGNDPLVALEFSRADT
jgi:mannose-6-phosphate isomerase-like protein (cupin superfamily)